MQSMDRTSRIVERFSDTHNIDMGLRNFMTSTYNKMALGIGFSGAIAWFISSSPSMAAAVTGPMFWVLFAALFGLGWFAPKIIMSKSLAAAHGTFWVYSGLWGVLLAPHLAIHAEADIAKAFFSAAIAFASASLVGYTTKKNLTTIGNFLSLATFGILAAILLNFFLLQSSGFDLILSVVVVLVFSGLTAVETQELKSMYYSIGDSELKERAGILGALTLYGSFVTLFVWILNILGIMRSE